VLQLDIALILICILFNLWIIFLGGAQKIQDSLLGYFEFGVFADNASYIRVLGWFGLAASVLFVFI
jgi:hypothetical protein